MVPIIAIYKVQYNIGHLFLFLNKLEIIGSQSTVAIVLQLDDSIIAI